MSHRSPKVWVLHYSFHSRVSPYLNLMFFLLLSTKFVNKVFWYKLCQYILPESCLKYNVLRVVASEIFHQFHKQHGAQAFGGTFSKPKNTCFYITPMKDSFRRRLEG